MLMIVIVVLASVGICFTFFGLKFFFEAGFIEKLPKGLWKPMLRLFSGRKRRIYEKYIGGICFTLTGVLFLIAAISYFIYLY